MQDKRITVTSPSPWCDPHSPSGVTLTHPGEIGREAPSVPPLTRHCPPASGLCSPGRIRGSCPSPGRVQVTLGVGSGEGLSNLQVYVPGGERGSHRREGLG